MARNKRQRGKTRKANKETACSRMEDPPEIRDDTLYIDPNEKRNDFIQLSKSIALYLTETFEPGNHQLVDHILERDDVRIHVNYEFKRTLFNELKKSYLRENELTADFSTETTGNVSIVTKNSETIRNNGGHNTIATTNSNENDVAINRNTSYMVSIRRTRSELNGDIHKGITYLREAISQHKKWMEESWKSVSESKTKKCISSHGYYASQALAHKEMIQRYNDEIYELEFQTQYTSVVKTGVLDLHGFSVNDSKETLARILSRKEIELESIPFDVINIITGRGNHSDKRLPKLKPAVVSFLSKNKIKFTQVNEGLIKMFIT